MSISIRASSGCEGRSGCCVVLGPEQPEQDRQPDRPAAEARQARRRARRRPSSCPSACGARSPPAGRRRAGSARPTPCARSGRTACRRRPGASARPALTNTDDQEVQQRQPELVGVPAPAGEEVVRAAVMPHPGQPRGLQHPRHRAVADPADEPDHQHAERLKRRLREARRQQGQQPGKRSGNLTHGGDPPVRGPRPASSTPRGPMGLIAHRIRGRRHPSSAGGGADASG